jgi:hypothetical protein
VSNSVYKINKGINKSIQFKGLKAQYIWWLAGGMMGLLVIFAILYIIGVNGYISIGIIGIGGVAVCTFVFRLSSKYGEHGLKKKMASRSIPKVIKNYSRKQFIHYGTKF